MKFTLEVSATLPNCSRYYQTFICVLCHFPGVQTHISHFLPRTPLLCPSVTVKWIYPKSDLSFPTVLFSLYLISTPISQPKPETRACSLPQPSLSSIFNLSTNPFISAFCRSHESPLPLLPHHCQRSYLLLNLISFLTDVLAFYAFYSSQICPWISFTVIILKYIHFYHEWSKSSSIPDLICIVVFCYLKQ